MKTLVQTSPFPQNRVVSIRTTGNIRFVDPEKIVYMEASNNYTSFHLSDGSTCLMCKPLSYYEEILCEKFYRSHRSFLVNRKHILEIDTVNGNLLLLNDGKTIPISRRRLSHFRRLLIKKSI